MKTAKKRVIVSVLAALGIVASSMTGALAWTSTAPITCTSSTGTQIHIRSTTTGARYDTVTRSGAAVVYPVTAVAGTFINKTAKSVADRVDVSAGTVTATSRYCGS